MATPIEYTLFQQSISLTSNDLATITTWITFADTKTGKQLKIYYGNTLIYDSTSIKSGGDFTVSCLLKTVYPGNQRSFCSPIGLPSLPTQTTLFELVGSGIITITGTSMVDTEIIMNNTSIRHGTF